MPRRCRVWAPLVVLIALALAISLVDCDALRGPPPQGPGQAPSASRTSTPLPAGVSPTRVTVYFPRYFEDGSLGLRGVERTVRADQTARGALEALIAGPDGPERALDLEYPLNRRTKILSLGVESGIASVEFGPELAEVRGRPFSELAYWSIVYTLTDVSEIQGVSLLQAGQPLRNFGYPPVPIPVVAGRVDAPAWVTPR